MKKIICIIIILALTLPFLLSRKGISRTDIEPLQESKQDLDIVWNESEYKGTIKPYSAKLDLSNLSNTLVMQEMNIIDKYMLSKNQFLIKKPEIVYEQPFNIYEDNMKKGIPNFITTDSILHAYNLMCDYVIRTMERERLIDELKLLTEGMFGKSIEIYYGTKDANVKKAALSNIAYFGIAMRLLELNLPGGIPLEASRIIDNDVKKIKARWPNGASEIFPYELDYGIYITDGHYSREAEFKNYFLTMMWYGSTPIIFDTYDSDSDTFIKNDEQIAMAVIMTSAILGDEKLRTLWEDIYKVSTVYFDKSEDMTIYDLSDVIKSVYGKNIDFDKVWNDKLFKKVYELSRQKVGLNKGKTLPDKINDINDETIKYTQFRLMGQIYALDKDIFDKVSVTGLPQGLYLPAVYGSDRAYEILRGNINDYKNDEENEDIIDKLRIVLNADSQEEPIKYSLKNSLFWVLKGSINSVQQGYPGFMLNDGWNVKKHITYLGGVADSKHSSYISLKQNKGQAVGQLPLSDTDISDAVIPGYVEPEIDIYSRLEYMAKYIKAVFSVNEFKVPEVYRAVDSFISLTSFLKTISEKELLGKPLTKDEETRLKNYGRELRNLTICMIEESGSVKYWESIPETERNMAAVSDAYIHENQVLHAAIGSPDYLFVVIPYNEELYLARGSTYSYYEFIEPQSKKLQDDVWQDWVEDNMEPQQQQWIRNIRQN
ncbi:hypothetical protein OXPF_27050 [Oxobacter pfennigii]|uniref:DUF3160 domain-containing protein n=1 Tax=Oxobacter pfennigii TaxID=36849 RepID=A0A0P8WZ36_9CLOT|nr:DUF3160 domain-containing protein [Oxobacter pfennigii]KPU43725.1 hypothetical protein OXPF_27050 [Oxobacter pfennigii]